MKDDFTKLTTMLGNFLHPVVVSASLWLVDLCSRINTVVFFLCPCVPLSDLGNKNTSMESFPLIKISMHILKANCRH